MKEQWKNKDISGVSCRHYPETDSTNAVIKRLIREEEQVLPMPFCVFADRQTKGRGRMDRTFVSPGGGLYMSVLLPAEDAQKAYQLTPLAAVAVLRALKELSVFDVQIKWVNDLYLKGKKICGILCEGVQNGPQQGVIVGIGVNLQTPENGFPPEAGAAGALDREDITRDQLLEKILLHLQKALPGGMAEWSDYENNSMLNSRHVICRMGDRELSGFVRGIGKQYELLLETEDGEKHSINCGEVTKVRPMARAAFFDFDGTMRPGDSIVPYVAFVRKKKKMPLWQYIWVLLATAGYLLRIVPSTVPKTAALRFRKRLTEEENNALDREFARYLIESAYPVALKKWSNLRKEGNQMVLLSASTENYMCFVAELLEADALLCTPIDGDGKVRHNCHGKDKVVRAEEYAAKENVSLEESCAFGDSGSDIYILTRVGDGVAVNAKQKLLKKIRGKDIPSVSWR